MTIDELTDANLAQAVAEAQDWEYISTGTAYILYEQGEIPFEPSRQGYRPDQNISQAWELLDGYIYSVNRHENISACYIHTGDVEVDTDAHIVTMAWGNTDAEAICRAWLKVKEILDE
jgi:hypothetical protein